MNSISMGTTLLESSAPPFPQRIGTGKNRYNRIETRQRIGNEETTLYSRFIDSILTTSLRESGCHSVYRKMRL